MPRTLVLAVLALAALACGGSSASVCEEACAKLASCNSSIMGPQCVSRCESQLKDPAALQRFRCATTASCDQVESCLQHTEDQ
jgi:hypothetical protein